VPAAAEHPAVVPLVGLRWLQRARTSGTRPARRRRHRLGWYGPHRHRSCRGPAL